MQNKMSMIRPPISYEEHTRCRPTKRRIYNYSALEGSHHDPIKLPISNYQPSRRKDFSFENNSSPLSRASNSKEIESKVREEKRSAREATNERSSSLGKKYNINQRLDNISSLNDKISSLLNVIKPKRREESSEYLPLHEQNGNIKWNREAYQREDLTNKKIKPTFKYTQDENFSQFASMSLKVKEFQIKQNEYNGQNYPIRSRKYHYHQKETIPSSPQKQRTSIEAKQTLIVKNMTLDTQISEITNKILNSSSSTNKTHTNLNQEYRKTQKNDVNMFTFFNPKESSSGEIKKIAQKLSKLIQFDIVLFKLRQSFESWTNLQKWSTLKMQLRARGVFLEQASLKSLIQTSVHEKNPFSIQKMTYSLNQVKDLAKLIAEAQQFWSQQLHKGISLELLTQQNFSLHLIDFNSKGTISLQDLVCFVNVNTKSFYRSRDVANVFKRFLQLEGKSLEKDISLGIQYSTFMDKIAQ